MASQDEIETHLLEVTKKAGKSYSFDNDHDPSLPVDVFFQESDQGVVLFVIYYTRACRWSMCSGCTLPSTQSQRAIDFRSIVQQTDHIFALPAVQRRQAEIRKVIVSNQGSVLDEVTFSSMALMYLLCQIKLKLPDVAVISLETRPEYVDEEECEFIARALGEGRTQTDLELAVGFEAFDDDIRNRVFNKGLSLAQFEKLVDTIARHHFHLKCYFMQKPVADMSDDDAVRDIHRAIDYLAQLADRRNASISMHLNPTYVPRGTPLETRFHEGRYQPPSLLDVARAAQHAKGTKVPVFIGLNDEGMAVEGGSFIRQGDERLIEQLELFNRTRDYHILDALLGG